MPPLFEDFLCFIFYMFPPEMAESKAWSSLISIYWLVRQMITPMVWRLRRL